MQHLSLRERAYNIIRERIINGGFEPGVRIREDLLADEISMSRTPVREAINRLAAEGLVNNIPRKGVYSLVPDRQQLLDGLDVRQALESLSVRRCIEKITPGQLSELERLVDEFEKELEKGDYERCNDLDNAFHEAIAQISGNRKLIEFLSEIGDFMRIARYIEKKAEPEVKNRLTLREHTAILECIRKGDTKAAVAAMKENIDRMLKNMGIQKEDV